MPSSEFELFGFAHIAAMGVILAVPIVLTLVVKWLDSAKATLAICQVIQWFKLSVSCTVIRYFIPYNKLYTQK